MKREADTAELTLYDVTTKEDIRTFTINVSRWKYESTFFDSYIRRWSDGSRLTYGVSSMDVDAFSRIVDFVEYCDGFQSDPNVLDSALLMNIMQMAFVLGMSNCLNEAFSTFTLLKTTLRPTFQELTLVATSPYFGSLEYTDYFFHRYVRERYRHFILDISEEELSVFPMVFMENLLSWDDIFVTSENDVVLFVDKWISLSKPSEEEIASVVKFIRVTRLSLPFINQVLMSVPWMKVSREQLYIIQNLKANEDNMNVHDCISFFSTMLPSTWLSDYRNNVFFKCSESTMNMPFYNKPVSHFVSPMMSVRIHQNIFHGWVDDKTMNDPFVVELQNTSPIMGFFWKITLQIYKDDVRRVQGIVQCGYETYSVAPIKIFHMLSLTVSMGDDTSGDFVTHTDKLKTFFVPKVHELPADWTYFNQKFGIEKNDGLVISCRIKTLDT